VIIALDGLAGSGKGTIAREFARQHGFVHVDAGLIFRSCAFAYGGGVPEEKPGYFWDGERSHLFVGGQEVTHELKSIAIAKKTAELAADKNLFAELVSCVRSIANRFPNVICDGRSIASDIFPDCDLAFLVEAGLAVRAFRRWKDLSAAGSVWSFNEVKDSIASRDQTDRYRLSSPYRRTAKHVLVLRSDVLTVQQSVDCIFTHVQVLQFVS